jgi:hypothetical protein
VLWKTCGYCPDTVVLAAFLSLKHERLHCQSRQCSSEVMMDRSSQHYFDLEIDLVSTHLRHVSFRPARDFGLDLAFRSGLFVPILHRGRAHDPDPSPASFPLTGCEDSMARDRGRGQGRTALYHGLGPNLLYPSRDLGDRERVSHANREVPYLFQIGTTVHLSNRAASLSVMLSGRVRRSFERQRGRILGCSRRGLALTNHLGRFLFEKVLGHRESLGHGRGNQGGR